MINGQRAVIEPRRGHGERPVPGGLILSFTPADLDRVRVALGLSGEPGRTVDLARLWTCGPPSAGVGLVGPALGAPAAALLMERLIVLGARWIVGVGSCGSLQPHIRIGEVVVPTGALVEEGTSAHYGGPDVRIEPNPVLLEALRRRLKSAGISPRFGKVWTTDAPFRETVDKVTRYRDSGILAVDMETSALMAVASFRRVAFASLMVVSDELGELKWRRGFGDERFLEALGRAAGLAARALADCLRGAKRGTGDGEAG